MNMKKSLIALAVAGTVAAPAAFAATANVDVYGIMNIAIEDTDMPAKDLNVVDNYSRIGFKGSEDLGGGLKAIWQIETQLSAGASDGVGGNGGDIANRNTFIGLSGGFGTALVGRHDTPYKIATGKYDIFGDTIADYNLGRLDNVQLINGSHDHRSPDAIAYISPTWSGFHFAAAVITTGVNANLDSGDNLDAYSLAGMYANGPLTVDVGYQDVDVVDSKAWKVGVGYTFGDFKVGFVYEDVSDYVTGLAAKSGLDRDSWMASLAYNMGAMTFKGMYGQADVDVAAGTLDQDMWAIGMDYALSKRTSAYVVYGVGDDDVDSGAAAAGNRDSVAGWTIGMKHSF
jgi:predicted porin